MSKVHANLKHAMKALEKRLVSKIQPKISEHFFASPGDSRVTNF